MIVYKQVAEQAKDFIAASAVYLAQELGSKIYTMYSAEGLYRIEDYEWDKETGKPIAKEDKELKANNVLPGWVDMVMVQAGGG